MKLEIRKLVTYIEETFIEGGKTAPQPLKLFAAAAAPESLGRACFR